jgi:cephalosporin hydroxylase
MGMANNRKKIYTRAEFEALRRRFARKMDRDQALKAKALALKIQAGHKYYWVHQFNWMGEPFLQLTTDLMAFQEIIYRHRPEYVVEIGVAWGGSLLMYATLAPLVGIKKVVGVDVFIPADLRQRLASKTQLARYLHLVEGSSVDENTVRRVKKLLGRSRRILVILDSNHTEAHVLQELQLYTPLIGKGGYLVVGDTVIERQPPAHLRPRAWGQGNNPATALRKFRRSCTRFVPDRDLEAKLLFTNMPGGYWLCRKDP